MDYQGNTNRDKEERKEVKPEKHVEKVITGEAIQKPKTLGRKFKDVFLGGDLKAATRYVAADVLLPAFRNLIVDATSKGIERIVYGESMFRQRQVDYRSRVQYNNPLWRQDPRTTYRPSRPITVPHRVSRREIHDIIIPTRDEADEVVERLIDIIDKYEVASLADFYDLTGLPTSHVDNKWGWTYLNNVEVRQVREGYLIDLPALEEI